ncbi:MAG TPA: hypothetical protein PKL73_06030, partial [Polyangiaceae bacterium]|nr:hypothetical protein [Polyangiaceae bacterium]
HTRGTAFHARLPGVAVRFIPAHAGNRCWPARPPGQTTVHPRTRGEQGVERIEVRDDLWWYAGRASQPAEDFSWEQSVYHELGHSRAFIHRTNPGSVYLVGEGLRQNAERIKQQYRGIDRLICCPIYRDRRHRARIDRRTTLRKGAPWLPG